MTSADFSAPSKTRLDQKASPPACGSFRQMSTGHLVFVTSKTTLVHLGKSTLFQLKLLASAYFGCGFHLFFKVRKVTSLPYPPSSRFPLLNVHRTFISTIVENQSVMCYLDYLICLLCSSCSCIPTFVVPLTSDYTSQYAPLRLTIRSLGGLSPP
jgi:hypothetical protein